MDAFWIYSSLSFVFDKAYYIIVPLNENSNEDGHFKVREKIPRTLALTRMPKGQNSFPLLLCDPEEEY